MKMQKSALQRYMQFRNFGVLCDYYLLLKVKEQKASLKKNNKPRYYGIISYILDQK